MRFDETYLWDVKLPVKFVVILNEKLVINRAYKASSNRYSKEVRLLLKKKD